MSKRLPQIKRFDSSEVQGEGAFVDFHKFKWGELRDMQTQFDAIEKSQDSGALVTATEKVVVERLASWNWVDENDQPLNLPKTPEELGKLTSEEINFLTSKVRDMMRGVPEEGKGSLKN